MAYTERPRGVKRNAMDQDGQFQHPIPPDLAALTLLEGLHADHRPSFVLRLTSPSTYNETFDLVYSNPALNATTGLRAKITGHHETGMLHSTATQLAFRNWACGVPQECGWPAHIYTFEGHLWNTVTIGHYRIISGVPTFLMWLETGPSRQAAREMSLESKTLQSKYPRDTSPPTTPPALPGHLPANPEDGGYSTDIYDMRERKFQRFAERSDVALFIMNPRGEYTYRNQGWYNMFDIASSVTNAGEAWGQIAFEEDMSFCEAVFGKLVMNHESVTFELRTRMQWLPPPDLSQSEPEDVEHFRWILCSAYPELGPNDELIEIYGTVMDISKQKWAEGLQKYRTNSALQGKQHLEHFIDTTSHEMRNPLSAIMQCADSIISSYSEDECSTVPTNGWSAFLESTLDAAQTIVQCAQHMRHIVDDILTISKLDSGLLDMTPVVVQPENIARHAVKMFEAEAKAAEIDLSLAIDQSYRDMGIDWTSLDPTRVLQILINLLTNAIKFTRLEKTKVIKTTVSASATEPLSSPGGIQFNEERLAEPDRRLEEDWKDAPDLLYLQFSVTDTGRGLSAEERGNLFARFSQASPRTHINYGGSGLGLFISRRLTELQGGSIGLSSQSGRGSTFSFYIKTRRAIPTTTRNGSLPHVFPEDVKHRSPVSSTRASSPLRSCTTDPDFSVAENGQNTNSQHLQSATKQDPDPLHVLIVEDNLVNQRVLAKQLRNLGCTISVANHGQEALEFLPRTILWNRNYPLSRSLSRKEHHVPSAESMPSDYGDQPPIPLDLILMDWEMPIMNGLEAAKEIRRLESQGLLTGRVPVIGVTANVRQQQIVMAVQAGMDHVVGKPFRVTELLSRMREVVARVADGARQM